MVEDALEGDADDRDESPVFVAWRPVGGAGAGFVRPEQAVAVLVSPRADELTDVGPELSATIPAPVRS